MPIEPVNIFISSPNDVRAERERARLACQELQAEPFVRRHFRLDYLAYEESVPPVVGVAPQMTVDRYMQAPGDADILVCILWGRLGSPHTDRNGRAWDSGTVYELTLAVEKFKRTGQRPVVLLYPCVRDLPADADPEQVAKVKRFFAQFRDPSGDLQGIYEHRAFRTVEEFADKLKHDLREVLAKFGQSEAAPGPPRTPHDALAKRVKEMWVSGVEKTDAEQVGGVLRTSLEGRPPIALPLYVAPESALLRASVTNCHTGGVWLKALFRESNHRLLLTARGGAGKTIALLQLLQLLLKDCPAGMKGGQVPVVLDATSWQKRQSAEEWILHELDRLYNIRRATALQMVKNRQLIYLIDGVDQIGLRSRAAHDPQDTAAYDPALAQAWVRQFSALLRKDSQYSRVAQTPIVLCCREERLGEFAELFEAGRFQTVSVLAPRLEDVLAAVRADPTVPDLAKELEHNTQLQQLAEIPLFLQMLMSVFRSGSPYRPLAGVRADEQRHELISTYVELRFREGSDQLRDAQITLDQVRPWLTWLALHQNRSPFLIELMQPDMLPPPDRRWYRWAAAAALATTLTALGTLPPAVGLGIEWGARRSTAAGVQTGLVAAAVLFSLALALAVPVFRWGRGWRFGLLLGVVFSVVRGIAVGAGCPGGALATGWEAGLKGGLISLLCAVPLMVYAQLMSYRITDIHPLSNWNFETRGLRKSLLCGAGVGFGFWFFFGVARGITFGAVTALLLTWAFCLRRSGFDVPNQPNQGIVRSQRNALIFGLAAVLILTPVVSLSYGLQFGWQTGLENGVQALVTPLAGLFFGGIPVLQHWSLRVLCAWRGYLPLRLVRFLDAMTGLMLLQRVGGGYRFSHDFIVEFFARRQAPAGPAGPVPGPTP